jgi:hypothetical protein
MGPRGLDANVASRAIERSRYHESVGIKMSTISGIVIAQYTQSRFRTII